ncbi:MAG: hypothetical protein QG577_2770 [Thermodesulfobacteriota bacterium]|nr:hypothetical protein [Thermodesulfobacteriota bacterium]
MIRFAGTGHPLSRAMPDCTRNAYASRGALSLTLQVVKTVNWRDYMVRNVIFTRYLLAFFILDPDLIIVF